MGLEQEQYGQGGHLGEAGGHRYEPYLGHGEEAGLVVGAHCVASGSSRGQGWSSMGHTTLCVYSVISTTVVTTILVPRVLSYYLVMVTTLHTYSDRVNCVRSVVTPRRRGECVVAGSTDHAVSMWRGRGTSLVSS